MCESINLFWIYKNGRRAKSFIRYAQVFSDKTATTINSTSLTAHSVNLETLKVSVKVRLLHIENCLTLVAFLASTMENYGQSKSSLGNVNRSAV